MIEHAIYNGCEGFNGRYEYLFNVTCQLLKLLSAGTRLQQELN